MSKIQELRKIVDELEQFLDDQVYVLRGVDDGQATTDLPEPWQETRIQTIAKYRGWT